MIIIERFLELFVGSKRIREQIEECKSISVYCRDRLEEANGYKYKARKGENSSKRLEKVFTAV